MNQLTYKKFLDKEKNRILSYAYYFLRNWEDAEDVTQEVFVKLWQYRDKIEQNKVTPWIMRVAHNQCIDLIRKKKADKRYFGVSLDNHLHITSQKSDKILNPELSYEYSELQKLILNALEMLTEKTRSMLLLHYFQGYKYDVIGEILNTNVNTVKVGIHRGKKLLRDILKEQFPEQIEKVSNEHAV
ncbi:RNA polymerase sigma factor [bacterium]|nr:RNA polymerase sigma factor [bacterium]